MNRYWTRDREQELRRLWADGLTASQIAEQLGEVSRNAVLGKAFRLNLERRGPSVCKSMRFESIRSEPNTATSPAKPRVAATHPPAPPVVKTDAPGSPHCQWIFGDNLAEFTFCQDPRQARSSYCAQHHARCYIRREASGHGL